MTKQDFLDIMNEFREKNQRSSSKSQDLAERFLGKIYIQYPHVKEYILQEIESDNSYYRRTYINFISIYRLYEFKEELFIIFKKLCTKYRIESSDWLEEVRFLKDNYQVLFAIYHTLIDLKVADNSFFESFLSIAIEKRGYVFYELLNYRKLNPKYALSKLPFQVCAYFNQEKIEDEFFIYSIYSIYFDSPLFSIDLYKKVYEQCPDVFKLLKRRTIFYLKYGDSEPYLKKKYLELQIQYKVEISGLLQFLENDDNFKN